MKEYVAILVFVIMIATGCRYAYQIIKCQISPTLSTWIMFSVATCLNVLSYLVATEMDILSGVLGITDAIACLMIVIAMVAFGKSGLKFKPFERYYLLGSSFIVLFWVLSNNAFHTNLLVQCLIFLGYFPTFQSLITSKETTESFSAWGLNLSAGIISLYPAIKGGNLLSTVYSIRTIVMVSLVLIIMFIKYKTQKR